MEKEKRAVVDIQSVSKRYRQGNRVVSALEDVSLVVEEGDIYGIIGLSGAGKSTLIRSVAGLVAPSSGRILFCGQEIAALDRKGLRNFHKKIGMIFQHFNLLHSRTVAENIAYPLEIASMLRDEQGKRVDELLDLVGLTDKKLSYPSQLSGGEKQRVGIARALANYPELLLCDEATSALDPKTTQEILNLLKKIHRELNITILLITHEMEVVKRLCNKVAVIEKGRIIEEGAVTRVFTDPQQPTTRQFLQNSSHQIPKEFFQGLSSTKKLVRLTFKGDAANEPVISDLVRTCQVNVNILLGWVDRIQALSVGTLVVELSGDLKGILQAFDYLEKKKVHYEEVKDEL